MASYHQALTLLRSNKFIDYIVKASNRCGGDLNAMYGVQRTPTMRATTRVKPLHAQIVSSPDDCHIAH